MRESYHRQLAEIQERLGHMGSLASVAMHEATQALVTADLTLAETVIRDDETLDLAALSIEDEIVELIALQAPVASDLRLLVASLSIVRAFERMGDLARHLAEIVSRRHPSAAVPTELRPTIERMGELAARLAVKAGWVTAEPDQAIAGELESDDDELDLLHRKLLAEVGRPDWPHGVQAGVDLVLAGRFCERFADQAVSVGRRVLFLTCGWRAAAAPARTGT